MEKLLEAKDQIIWALLQEKPNEPGVTPTVNQELADWGRLSDRY
mgnify:CR=1 FL=1